MNRNQWLLASLSCLLLSAAGAQAKPQPGPAVTDVQAAFDGQFPALVRTLRTGGGPCGKKPTMYCGGMEAGNVQALYNTQIATTTLLLYLRAQVELPEANRDPGTVHMIDRAAQLYGIAFDDYLSGGKESGGLQYRGWVCGPVCESTVGKGNAGKEIALPSVQYAFGASRVMRLITQLPASDRTKAMSRLLGYAPYMAETYVRWVTGDLQRRIDPGKPGFPAGDVGIQAAAGIAELTAALDAEPGLGVPGGTRGELDRFLEHYWEDVFLGRGEFSPGPRDPSKEVWVWDRSLTTRNYGAKFMGARYRNAKDPAQPPPNAQAALNADPQTRPFSLDMGHYARVPDAAESFRQRPEYREEAERVLRGIAQQMLQVNWNGDAKHPRWTNYADGTDGWFGTAFSPPCAQGKDCSKSKLVSKSGAHGPGKLVPASLPLLGRFLWTMRYEPDVARVAQAVEAAHPDRYKYRSADRVSSLSLIPMQAKYLLH